MIVACLAVTVAFTSCGSGGSSGSGGKGLSGTYVGYEWGNKISIIFSGNKLKVVAYGEVNEGIYELIEEYKDDNFSRGKLKITHREGKDESNYTLEGKKGEILIMGDYNSLRLVLIKGGKSVTIPSGTYGKGTCFTFSGNNLKTEGIHWGDGIYSGNEYPYEFIVGYEDKGISKGYILIRNDNKEYAIGCALEKDKLTLGGQIVLTKE